MPEDGFSWMQALTSNLRNNPPMFRRSSGVWYLTKKRYCHDIQVLLPFLILSHRRTISSPPLALHVRRLSRQMLRLWTSSET